MMRMSVSRLRTLVLLSLALGSLGFISPAQDPESARLARARYTSGDETLLAFEPVSSATRHSIAKLNVNGETVALATVMDQDGLALTKASELRPGKMTAWLATDQEVSAQVLAEDEDEDVALVRIHAKGLKPVVWTTNQVVIGEWAVTPGIIETPHAVGIVSALPRHIRPRRAFIGVRFDIHSPVPKIESLIEGMSAEKAGLRAGDIIIGVNNSAVTNREQVTDTLSEFREGQNITLRVKREQQELERELTMMAPTNAPYPFYTSSTRTSRLAGQVSQRAEGFEKAIEHDTVLKPWLCGGPLMNLEGKAMGMNIARAGRVSTYALPASLVERLFQNLKVQAGLGGS